MALIRLFWCAIKHEYKVYYNTKVDLDLVYGKVKFDPQCFSGLKIRTHIETLILKHMLWVLKKDI